MADTDQECANCHKTAADLNLASLNRCSKCKSTSYCNRDCQKAHWKSHKKVCASQANANAASGGANTERSSNASAGRLKNLESQVSKPFTKLDQGKFLHDRTEQDVFKLLIDSFRLRQADEVNMEGKITPGSVYAGAASSIEPFRHYLAQAAKHHNMLPSWWTADKQKDCEAFAESGVVYDLRKQTTKQDIINHYGSPEAPMQLRMLAEAIYGAGLMGQSGDGMRKMMMRKENAGPGDDQFMSLLNMA